MKKKLVFYLISALMSASILPTFSAAANFDPDAYRKELKEMNIQDLVSQQGKVALTAALQCAVKYPSVIPIAAIEFTPIASLFAKLGIYHTTHAPGNSKTMFGSETQQIASSVFGAPVGCGLVGAAGVVQGIRAEISWDAGAAIDSQQMLSGNNMKDCVYATLGAAKKLDEVTGCFTSKEKLDAVNAEWKSRADAAHMTVGQFDAWYSQEYGLRDTQ